MYISFAVVVCCCINQKVNYCILSYLLYLPTFVMSKLTIQLNLQ